MFFCNRLKLENYIVIKLGKSGSSPSNVNTYTYLQSDFKTIYFLLSSDVNVIIYHDNRSY